MLPYWFLFGIFATGAAFYRQRPDWRNRVSYALMLTALIPILMVGFRYQVGADWDGYMLIYGDLRYRDIFAALNRSDPAYGLLNWAAHRLGLEIWAVNLACAVILIYGLVRFAAFQPNPWLAMVIAIPYFVIVVAMGYTRQGAAIGLMLVAFTEISNRSFGKFIFWTVMAGTFHRSAVILLPIVALSYSRNRLLTVALGAVATVMGYFFIIQPVLDVYISRYSAGSEFESQGTLIRLAMNFIPGGLYLLLQNRFPIDKEERKIWRNLSILAIASMPLFFYLETSTALDRLALYMIPLQIFVLSSLPYVLNVGKHQSRMVAIGVILYSAAVQFVWLNFAGHASYWLPYRLYPIF